MANFFELSRDELISDCLAFNLFDENEVEDLEWGLKAIENEVVAREAVPWLLPWLLM